MDKIRIGVAGANGAFGTKHLEALTSIDAADVTAVMATSMEKANRSADQFGVQFRFNDYDTMLASGEIDAVILATPTQLHAEQGIKAMDAGLHVLVEIPMADCLKIQKRWLLSRLKKVLSGWQGMSDVLTRLISGCITKSLQAR